LKDETGKLEGGSPTLEGVQKKGEGEASVFLGKTTRKKREGKKI